MKKFITIILIAISVLLPCQSAFARKKTAEQKREIQTQIFDTPDKTRVMLAAVNTLQDSGFIIEDINFEFGFLRAKKTFKEKFSDKKRVLGWSTAVAVTGAYTALSYGTSVGQMINPTRRVLYELRNKTVEVNSNVTFEQIGSEQIKVRFVFVEKVFQNADGFSFTTQAPIKIIRINKPSIYKEFFNQIQEKLQS